MRRSAGGFARLLMSSTTTATTTTTAMMRASSSSSSVTGTPTLKLLGPSVTRAFRCLWMLEELGVKYELDELVRPQSRRARQYSGAGKVPILLHYRETTAPPLVLTESLAINTYLGDTFPIRSETYPAEHGDDDGDDATDPSYPPLRMPSFGTLERVKYDQLVCCILSELDAASLWVHHKHTSPDLAKVFGFIPELAEPCRANFARANRELAQLCRPYLLGPHFTPVDIAYVHCLEWATRQQWDDHTNSKSSDEVEEWPAALLDPYLARCRARPAYRRAQRIRKACLLEGKRRQQQEQEQQEQQEQKDLPTDPPASSGAASKL
jgi:glutathione S-transferase